MVALRAVELHVRPDVTEWAVDIGWAWETIARYKSPEFDRAAELLYKWEDAQLDVAVEAGVLSPRQRAQMKALNRANVPFYRVMDSWASGYGVGEAKRIANRRSHYREIKGSGKRIINPFESMTKNAFALANLISHNKAMQA